MTIIASISSHIVGTFLPISEEQLNKGVVGYNGRLRMCLKKCLAHVFWDNMWPDFRDAESFITVFGVYFPAMTGIMGGMERFLKNLKKAKSLSL